MEIAKKLEKYAHSAVVIKQCRTSLGCSCASDNYFTNPMISSLLATYISVFPVIHLLSKGATLMGYEAGFGTVKRSRGAATGMPFHIAFTPYWNP